MKLLRRIYSDPRGATMVEYAVMVGLIAAVCIVIITAMGGKTSGEYSTMNALF
jgi:Flp pilus assembly pilin Flp